MEASWSTFLFQQANDALHHQHQVGSNSLLPLLNAGTELQDQKPIMPIPLDQKPPVSSADLLKDSMSSGTGGGGGHGGGGGSIGAPMPTVKKEPKSKTPFICGYCSKAFRDSYHLRRHESCHTGIKMVSRPKKTTQTTAPTMVPLLSSMTRENNGNPSYILTTAATSGSGAMVPTSTVAACQPSAPKKPAKPVKKNHGCEMCGKAFRDVYHLNRHKLSHSDEKPFECPICQQRFKRKDRMTYHVRSHDGGVHKPYVCSVCGKGFSRPDHLSCHVKHVHSSERPFKCQVTPLTDEDLTELMKSASEDETEDQEAPSQENQEDDGLTVEKLTELMRTAKVLQQNAKSWDSHTVRSLQFTNAIDCAMSTYKTLFTTTKKQ